MSSNALQPPEPGRSGSVIRGCRCGGACADPGFRFAPDGLRTGAALLCSSPRRARRLCSRIARRRRGGSRRPVPTHEGAGEPAKPSRRRDTRGEAGDPPRRQPLRDAAGSGSVNRQSASFSRASSQSSSSPSASSAGAACRSTTLLGIVREQPLMTASMSRRVMMWQEQTIIEAWISVGTAATLRRAHPTDDVFRRFQPASGGQSVSCPTQAALDTLSETLHVSMGGERRQSFCRDAALRASESRA